MDMVNSQMIAVLCVCVLLDSEPRAVYMFSKTTTELHPQPLTDFYSLQRKS
jgi:hypothetical protein